jgi:glycosyltransferase involved in cell wall biosynthesis
MANRLYYGLKPYLPWRLRIFFRRVVARKIRRQCQAFWPISEQAARIPEGWPGWPGGKRFAVVLTHDVEGPKGLARCRQLAQLEKQIGFRSSFNFIPDGDYVATAELREELRSGGWEVGVHDLHHDGKLFRARADFSRHARQINRFLEEWNVNGFRAGFMHHQLDWLHELNIKYDASTFDTDPFEPQPDGVDTIFPFWVSGGCKNRGYVELPYTLPQDSTLFLLLRETSSDIWKRKVDWVAAHGGMVLVDTHPDYIDFNGGSGSWHEYPKQRYVELLTHIRHKFAGQYWHALPQEVAEFCTTVRPRNPVLRRRICMVSYSAYESDNRVMRYAEALSARGDSVDVLAVKTDAARPDSETLSGVTVHRLQKRSRKNQQTRGAYLFPILRFWLAASFWLICRQLRYRYDLVHVHNVPDFLVFAAWAPRLAGAKIILDIHDILPEFYASKFHLESGSLGTRLLKGVERSSARFAHHVILSNHLWLDKFVTRSAAPSKCSVFINHVDRKLFYPRTRTRTDDKFIVLFPGGLQWHQGLDLAIRALAIVVKEVPRVDFHIYGDGNMRPQLVELRANLQLEEKVKFHEPLPLREIAQVMANADLGVVPKRADSFGNEAYSTKTMEFMALGVPVLVSRTKVDSYYFDSTVVRFFESGNVPALAEAMLELIRRKDLRDQLVTSASSYAELNSWERKREEYFELVDSLILGNGQPEADVAPQRAVLESAQRAS